MKKFIADIFILGQMLIIFNGVVTFPLIFNCLVIPKIEKKVGKKLEFTTPMYYWGVTWLQHNADIAWYIAEKYVAMKITKKSSDQIKYKPSAALQKINYRVETASKFEVFMSLATIINFFLFLLIGALMYFKVIA